MSTVNPMNPTRVYEYLVKARTHVFGWVRPLSPEQYTSEHPIGLGSLSRTLHHLMAAEWCYAQRITGRTEPLGPLGPEHDPETTTQTALPFAALEPMWVDQAAWIQTELAGVGDWSRELVCTTVVAGCEHEYRASPADFFAQLAFHEIHHRAQVLHMLRRVGVKTGEIDYNTLMFLGGL